MPNPVRILTHEEISEAARGIAYQLSRLALQLRRPLLVYPVPRGGIPAFYVVRDHYNRLTIDYPLNIAPNPAHADVFIDDLVDSGRTRDRMILASPNAVFLSLFDKGASIMLEKAWLVFPWEATEESSADDIFIRLLQFIGEDPSRGGLKETPVRMAKAWRHWTSGYGKEAVDIIKQFEDGSEDYNEMIHTQGIPFYSHCEHHLAPFFGTVTFAYIPKLKGKIVGLSKMNRLIDVFARRLQVQERLTVQVIDSFCKELDPLGAGITVRARHLCIESRGVQQQGCITTTSAFRGVMFDKPEARAEFFNLTK